MSEYVKKHKITESIFNILEKKTNYKKIREICNDSNHYNNYIKFLLNIDSLIYDRQAYLDFCLRAIKFLFILHISCIFKVNPHFMRSSDYIDCLESGVTPPKDIEYLVAPFITDIFDKEFKTDFIEIYNLIKESCEMQM